MAAAREKTLAHRGTQQMTCLQRGWTCFQNGGYSEKGEKNWVRDVAKVKINKMGEKLKFSSRKNRKNRHVLHVRVLGTRQSVRGLVFDKSVLVT